MSPSPALFGVAVIAASVLVFVVAGRLLAGLLEAVARRLGRRRGRQAP